MELTGVASAAEVVSAFLQGEIDSPRFAPHIRDGLTKLALNESIVRSPDLTNAAENSARERILSGYRGWPRQFLFAGFPADVRWNRAILTRAELSTVKYLNFPEWVARSGGTRHPDVAAQCLRTEIAADPSIRAACAAVAQRFNTGGPIAPILLVYGGSGTPIVVLEGCVRLTSVFYDARGGPTELEVLLGGSPSISQWNFY